jgi:hypothetical protein
MPVLVDNPAELGADRLVNAIAAFERYGGPCVVVDFGTATTFDVVSAKGEYLGGAIAPGIGISADALFARAARLGRVDIKRPAKVIGTNTVTHIQSGLYYGYIGLVDGILARIIEELGAEPRVIATGGPCKADLRRLALHCGDRRHAHARRPVDSLRAQSRPAPALPAALGAAVLNYFNYYTEIEDRFQQRRGALLLLSTLDWALIEMWREAGVPLEAVLRGIDAAFDKYEARQKKARMRRINGLAWCAQAVMQAAEELREAAAGRAITGSAAANGRHASQASSTSAWPCIWRLRRPRWKRLPWPLRRAGRRLRGSANCLRKREGPRARPQRPTISNPWSEHLRCWKRSSLRHSPQPHRKNCSSA